MKRILAVCLLALLSNIGFAEAGSGKDLKKKQGILLVTFGTSYADAQLAFENIEDRVEKAFPGVSIRWAYTSKMIRKKLAKSGQIIDSPAEALAKMGEDGFTDVAVQSLHIIPGEEYENLEKTVAAFNGMPKGTERVLLGKPLLFSHQDNENLASIIDDKFEDEVSKKTALVMMGHGTHHQANIYYPGFQYYLNQRSDRYFLGTVEGFPELSEVVKRFKDSSIKRVVLTPFMSVAGDHAQNDMAGDDSDSWKSILEKEGFKVKIVQKGLAEYDQVVDIWVEHLKEVYYKL